MIPLVVRPTTTSQRNPRSPKHRRTVPIIAQTKQSQREHKDKDLTRFGLDAYVLGARKGEGLLISTNQIQLTAMRIGKVLPLLYSPPQLHSNPLTKIQDTKP